MTAPLYPLVSGGIAANRVSRQCGPVLVAGSSRAALRQGGWSRYIGAVERLQLLGEDPNA
jgi:hypothetical protein